jgi:hypothetical protein
MIMEALNAQIPASAVVSVAKESRAEDSIRVADTVDMKAVK